MSYEMNDGITVSGDTPTTTARDDVETARHKGKTMEDEMIAMCMNCPRS